MSGLKKSETARAGQQAQPDLGRQYRPIGIGAVAAALTVTAEKHDEQTADADNSNERSRYWDSLAA